MKRVLAALALVMAGAQCMAAPAGGGLVTQLATEHVDITTHFTGEKILVFGAMSHQGDVVVKVVSPQQPVALSHKVAAGPFWLDGGQVDVRGTPGLFYLLSSRPLEQILSAKQRKRYGLEMDDALAGARLGSRGSAPADWQSAFTRIKRDDGHYIEDGHAVKLSGNRLFFANIELPAKLPLGVYQLQIYLIKDGKVIGRQSRRLDVEQVRLERWVVNTARAHSWKFGAAFTVLAMALGLALGMALRRDSDA